MVGVNCIHWLFTAAAIANVVLGQTITGPVDTAVERGTTGQLVCSVTGTSGTPGFIWSDITAGATIFSSGVRVDPAASKYTNFEVDESLETTPATSTISISNIAVADAGQYRCQVLGVSNPPGPATVTVEVRSTFAVNVSSPLREGEETTAQCDAVGGRPQETLTWYIDEVEQMDGVEDTNPTDPVQANVTNTRSVLTFTPRAANNREILSCRITGHAVTALNQRMDTTLDVQFPPAQGIMTVLITPGNPNLTIACVIEQSNQPNPEINLYTISANSTQLSSSNSPQTTTPIPEYDTEFTCTASNGIGDDITASKTYEVAGTTTPSPTTATPTAPNPGDDGNDTGASTDTPNNIAAIAGGVVGGLGAVIVVVLIWYFCCKRGDCGGACTCCPDLECCPDGNCCPCCDPEDPPKPVGGGSGSGKDNRVSGVATYNTSDPEKAAPVAKPRSVVQHDTNNPGGDMYAMVDKGGRGDRDYPDAGRNGRGQPADPQLTYADLDLSARKEVHIPKDEKEVVVYSSIVV